jgi:hypothetical protein
MKTEFDRELESSDIEKEHQLICELCYAVSHGKDDDDYIDYILSKYDDIINQPILFDPDYGHNWGFVLKSGLLMEMRENDDGTLQWHISKFLPQPLHGD